MTREEFHIELTARGWVEESGYVFKGTRHRQYWLSGKLLTTIGDDFAAIGALSFNFGLLKRSTVVMLVDAIVNEAT